MSECHLCMKNKQKNLFLCLLLNRQLLNNSIVSSSVVQSGTAFVNKVSTSWYIMSAPGLRMFRPANCKGVRSNREFLLKVSTKSIPNIRWSTYVEKGSFSTEGILASLQWLDPCHCTIFFYYG